LSSAGHKRINTIDINQAKNTTNFIALDIENNWERKFYNEQGPADRATRYPTLNGRCKVLSFYC